MGIYIVALLGAVVIFLLVLLVACMIDDQAERRHDERMAKIKAALIAEALAFDDVRVIIFEVD